MKKLISAILSLVLVCISIPVANAVSYNGLTLEKNSDGTYTITSSNIFTEDVSIPDNYNGVKITAIGQGAFQLKKNMTFIKIPDSIKTIGTMAFYGCTGLTSIYIGESVETIGAKAFNSCSALSYIDIKNTTMIGEMAFFGCKALESVTGNGQLKVIGKSAFSDCSAITHFDLGEELLYISDRAFSDCTGLTQLSFPDKLGYIGNSAYQNCTNISSVFFGSGELEIAPFAFENCTLLTEITIPDNVTAIGTNAFSLREFNSTETSHNLTISCTKSSAALSYAKLHGVSAYIIDYDITVSVFGDIDGDEVVTTADATQLLRIISGMESYQFTEYELFLYDLDNNSVMDINDVVIQLKKVADIA